MNIVVIGAGAMGCLYGGYLSKHNNVMMLDSYKPQVDAINNNGVTVNEDDGSVNHFDNIKACLSGEYNKKADLVIIFVKAAYTEESLNENKELFKEDTLVMTLQNGFGNDEVIEKFVNKENIIIGTSKHNSINLGNGCVKHSGNGETTIGSLVNNTHLQEIKNILQEAGFKAEISDNINHLIWSKLFVNLSCNPFTAIVNAPIKSLIENEYTWDYATKVVSEAIDVAKADGEEFDKEEILNKLHELCVDAGNGYTSMSQDVRKQLKTEIDTINGAVVKKGKQYGIPTPYNSLVVDLLHSIEATYKYHNN